MAKTVDGSSLPKEWQWEVTKLTDEMSKMSGRICLLENFIKEQFGNVFWTFCEKAAAAIVPSTTQATPGQNNYSDFQKTSPSIQKYSATPKNHSLLKMNQTNSNYQVGDLSKRNSSVENSQSTRIVPKPTSKPQIHTQHLSNQRFSPQILSNNSESSSVMHPKLHHQLTVGRVKQKPKQCSSVGISGTKLMLSNVSLPPSITITSVQEPEEGKDESFIEEKNDFHERSSNSYKSRPTLICGTSRSTLTNPVIQHYMSQNLRVDSDKKLYYSNVDVGEVKAEQNDSYGDDSVNEEGDEDVDGPCAMEIKLDPTSIDFSDDSTGEMEEYEHNQTWGYDEASRDGRDTKQHTSRNSANYSTSNTPNRTLSRPRRDIMQPTPCHSKCQNKCGEWSHEDRLQVFNSYIVLPTVQHKESWIMANLERTEIAKKKTLYSNFRTCTFKYYLPHPTFGLRQVCKAFFCATIGEPRNIVEKTAKALKVSVDDSNGTKEPIPFARRVPEKRRKPNSGSVEFSNSVSNMISSIQSNSIIKIYDSSENSL